MLTRRDFLSAIGLAPLAFNAVAANTIMGPAGPGTVFKKAWVDNPVHITQSCANYCWAASIAMIFAKHGHPISQERIVEETFGSLICAGAPNTLTIANDLSRSWVDDNGQPFTSIVTAAYDPSNGINALNNYMMINELSNDRPLLICNTHHAMVLSVIDYVENAYNLQVQGGAVLDPWPYSPKWHYLPPAEFTPVTEGGQMLFVASVEVS